MADLIMAGDQSGWTDLSKATIAETWGHAMDVPDMSSYESRLAANMLTPGAAMSGCPDRVHILLIIYFYIVYLSIW